MLDVRRREFIMLLGGAAAWPMTARAQHRAMPVVGFLIAQTPHEFTHLVVAFHRGLNEGGFVEGQNVAIEYRWAEDQIDRLPALAAELARRPLAAIAVTGGPPAILAAKAATTTIPIVFSISEDPVRHGLVASLARPGGNLTGINFFAGELTRKRLELLHQLVPTATRIAVLVNLASAATAEITLRDVGAAARAIGLQIQVHSVSTIHEINAVFATFVRERPDALFVGPDAWRHRTPDAARPRRRGDRIEAACCICSRQLLARPGSTAAATSPT
jgi:putative tryptophan/tyrosine transport system substrate-binding protein